MTPTASRALDPTTNDRPADRPRSTRDTPPGAPDPAPAASSRHTSEPATRPALAVAAQAASCPPLDEAALYVAHVYAVDYLDSWGHPARDLFATADQARARLAYLTARHRPAQLSEGRDR